MLIEGPRAEASNSKHSESCDNYATRGAGERRAPVRQPSGGARAGGNSGTAASPQCPTVPLVMHCRVCALTSG
eukprot:scaffold6653_cov115-Isochrysis_galbana.AAC.6